jgi:hypothetical protein
MLNPTAKPFPIAAKNDLRVVSSGRETISSSFNVPVPYVDGFVASSLMIRSRFWIWSRFISTSMVVA